MSDATVDQSKRTWIAITCGAGAVGATAVAVPFVSTFAPSERARAAGAPVRVDISALQPGEQMTVEWRGKPVWILHRTAEMLASLEPMDGRMADPESRRTAYPTPPYARNRHRSIKPEFLVAVGICSHLGCSPSARLTPGPQPSLPADWPGGFFCPCHGSTFDVAGRVFRNMPAPDNLEVPPHMYLSETVLLIGEDKQA
jgi:ubiquinol-cytochrome c reductase iron-sulfur subunit